MSASSTVPPPTARRAVPAPDAFTAAGAALAFGLALIGNYVQNQWKGDAGWGIDFSGGGDWAALGVVVAFLVVSTLVVGLATQPAQAAAPDRAAVRALILAGQTTYST